METWVYPQQAGENFITRFDIGFKFENDIELYESFGDIGNNIEECVYKNIENFSLGGLHTLLDAFNDTNTHTEIENWHLSGGKYKAFIGGFQIKGVQDIHSISIPNNLFEEIENHLKQYLWKEKYYFISFFFAFDGKNKTTNFMVNNINLEEEQLLLKQLDWQETQEYYSVRHFMVLKRSQE